jgi:hypothetical protein
MPGPFDVMDSKKAGTTAGSPVRGKGEEKPWFVGIDSKSKKEAELPPFEWTELAKVS